MIFAVGDIHGMYELLIKLHQKIMDHSAQYDEPHTVIFLGDYIDRGKQSKEVLDFLMTEPFTGFEHIYLKGNHEEMIMQTTTGYYNDVNHFLDNGGKNTCESFKISSNRLYDDIDWWKRTLAPYATWLNKLKLYHKIPGYLFVHAGIHPDFYQDIEQQRQEWLIWIRNKFLVDERDYGYRVIHGHTPTSGEPEVKHNRINIDTNAWATGILTAVVIGDDGEPTFLTTKPEKDIDTNIRV